MVVNRWASWCGPCRHEFPSLEPHARKRREKIAFLGVNSRDSSVEATAFLRRQPTWFAHVEDRDALAAREFHDELPGPTTALHDAEGKPNSTHPGAGRDQAALARDIDRHATSG